MKVLTRLIWVLLILSIGHAAPVYLDIEGGSGGNTARASDGDVNAWWTTATAPDGLWGRRTGFANNPNFTLGTPDNDVFEASGTGSGTEDAMLIVTTIPNLNPGSLYQVDVVFWSSTSQNWAIRIGFDASTSLYYDRLGANGATAGTPTGKTEGDRAEYTGFVGYAEADMSGHIKVYVNDKPSDDPQGGWYDRTWYDGLLVDKFNIAGSPVPPDDPMGVSPVPVDQDLGWTILDSNIEYIDLYLGTENEPNLILDPHNRGYKKLDFVPKTTSYDPGTLNFKTTYYWRVDTYEPNTLPGGTGTIRASGPVWSFLTVPEEPIVNPVVPAYTAVDAGEPNVVMSVTSFNVETFQWYKVGDPDVPLSDGTDYAGTGTDTLVINDIQLADEGYYYCVGTNSAGSDSSIDPGTGEGAGRLLTNRLISYWPLETDVLDAVSDFDMTLMQEGEGTTGLPTLTENSVNPLVVGDYSLFLNNGDHAADPNGQYAQIGAGVVDYQDITITAWVYWNGGSNWQRIFDFGNDTTHYMFLTPSHGSQCRFVLNNGGGEQMVTTTPLPTGQWVHVAATLGGNTGRLYVNGEPRGVNTGMSINPVDFSPTLNYIGRSQFTADPEFDGLIDDLKIYNYQVDVNRIAAEYFNATGIIPCIDPDFAGNQYNLDDTGSSYCKVDLADVAVFVANWLADGLYAAP